jgi:toxin-antitoxin system PIN domain toxin
MKPGLLDVNVLIALLDPSHMFHAAARGWFREKGARGWATCPLSENGCVRVMSNPGYPYPGLTVARVRALLAELVAIDDHRFWPDSVSLLDAKYFRLDEAGPKHLTDVYLLGLAVRFGGRLVTFDRSVRMGAVLGAGADSVEVIGG